MVSAVNILHTSVGAPSRWRFMKHHRCIRCRMIKDHMCFLSLDNCRRVLQARRRNYWHWAPLPEDTWPQVNQGHSVLILESKFSRHIQCEISSSPTAVMSCRCWAPASGRSKRNCFQHKKRFVLQSAYWHEREYQQEGWWHLATKVLRIAAAGFVLPSDSDEAGRETKENPHRWVAMQIALWKAYSVPARLPPKWCTSLICLKKKQESTILWCHLPYSGISIRIYYSQRGASCTEADFPALTEMFKHKPSPLLPPPSLYDAT